MAGWISILAGVIVCFVGLGWVAALFMGGGGPLGGVAIYLAITLIAGPLLLLGGPGVIYSAIKLMRGYAWARTVLEIFWWATLLLTTSYLAYAGLTKKEILRDNVMQGALYFLCTGVPSIIMLVLLRSDAIRRGLAH